MRVKAKESLAAAREAREAQIRAAARGAETGRGEPGRRRRKNSPDSTLYDSSDSYENHVIDLRGSPNRADVMDEGESMLRAVQSEGEGSLENGSGRADSSLGQYLSNGNGRKSKYQHVNNRNTSPEDEEEEEEQFEEPVQPREHDFIPGQLVWAKFARFPWWPAQTPQNYPPSEVQPSAGQRRFVDVLRSWIQEKFRKAQGNTSGWVDPFNNLSDFDVKLTERSKIRKKALQKGVEEALTWRRSGAFPEKWELTSKSIKQKKNENGHRNGAVSSPAEVNESPTDSGTKEKRAPRKRKPKVLFEEEGGVQRKPQRILRRFRIMRQLGLAAPAGSPFTSEYLRT